MKKGNKQQAQMMRCRIRFSREVNWKFIVFLIERKLDVVNIGIYSGG
jgi:hypothetical protein